MTTGRAAQARRAADALRQRIVAGEFANGRLPDEQALGRSLDTSRNVVREALNLLRDENLVTRRRGIGTLVTAHTYRHGLDRLAGLAEELTPYGTVSNEVREARVVPHAPPAITRRLDIPERSEAVYIERLRWLDGGPLSLDSTWLAPDIGHPLLHRDLAGRDLFALIEEVTGAALGSAEVTVHAVTAEPDTARVLDVAYGAALFAIDRLTRLPDGRPVDVESLRVRADRFALRAVLPRS
ncbi:GntR family transcriptional regulator [Streptomyces sp. NPDC058221]|uniref:GntR family transcriptional regulator n=1 Tax=Streptomyces sp. NPDC058221 TaxID=3346388 RepID=UPI0036ED6A93